MTKEMLMKLYEKNKEGKISTDQIFDMRYLSDKDIEFILSTANIDIAIQLYNDSKVKGVIYFDRCSEQFKLQIIDMINNGKKPFNRNLGTNAVVSLHNSGFYVKTLFDVISIANSIKNENIADDINRVVQYAGHFNAISQVEDDSYQISDELLLKIINKLLSTDKEYLVRIGAEFVVKLFNKKREGILKYLDILYTCKNIDQAYGVHDIVFGGNILNQETLFEILNYIAKSKGKTQIVTSYEVTCSSVQEIKDNILEFVRILANAKGEAQASYAKQIIDDIKILGVQDTITLSRTVANLPVNKVAVSKIARDIFASYEDKKNQISFWNLFSKNPRMAMELLDDNVSMDSEISAGYKVKKRNPEKR